jgi:hypothetical protein
MEPCRYRQIVERECSALLDFRRFLVSNGMFQA